jgi:hypothetical protein
MSENLITLCQPDAEKSCGACCGLYNYADSSRESLVLRMRARTKRFRETVKNPGDVEYYAEETFSLEDFTKRYEVIYCCEYLGFLDNMERKVGCLLHPAQNCGLDLRTCSFYGQEICAGHICPSHNFIMPSRLQSLLKIIDDWYLYGLCLTDIELVTTYFRLLADRIGAELRPEVFAIEDLKNVAREFFNWKNNWPFRSEEVNRLGRYYFDGSQYMISYIDYANFSRQISPLDSIFLSLSSSFNEASEIDQAENMIWSNMEKFVAAYQRFF